MEQELYREIVCFKDYNDKNTFNMEIQQKIIKLQSQYKDCIVTKEFYKGKDVLIRVCKIEKVKGKSKEEEEKQYIRERTDGFRSGGGKERIR